ncbi:hypothetical protein B0T24DRAFT_661739 [Lasiosphaeria ovina]|uniref:Extracellular serine-rich protein n=1 Tax=Lasiosphaeria ovina TaxID=92902 RepID=A0AAE0NKI8_9PEZI|nr:hypothetical protein B0T24DRAFT_661739 [Lasiosphaeria ovina]
MHPVCLLSVVIGVISAGVLARSYVDGDDNHATTTATSAPTEPSNPPSTSTQAGPETILIAVGAENNVFTPNSTTAFVGDTIRFNFYPGGHSVARAEYKYACIPYEYTGANKIGFYSGTISPQVISDNPPSYEIEVNDTNPIWFYCAAPSSCNGNGMVGVINPTDNETLDVQEQYAKNSSQHFAPGEPFPSEGTSKSVSASTPTTASTPPAVVGSTVTPQVTSQGQGAGSGGESSGLSQGAIAGIAVAAAAIALLGACLIYLFGRRGGLQHKAAEHQSAAPMREVNNYCNGGHPPGSPGLASLSTFSGCASFGPAPPQYGPPVPSSSPPPMNPGSQYRFSDYQGKAFPGGPGSPVGEMPGHTSAVDKPAAELPAVVSSDSPSRSPLTGFGDSSSWAVGQEAANYYKLGGKE